MAYSHTVFNTRFGWMAIAGSEEGLSHLIFPQPTPDEALALITDLLPRSVASTSFFGKLPLRLQCYFENEEINFPDKLDLRRATPFQRDVWRMACSIPYGETRTYGWIAKARGQPRCSRAVGQALARNPLPIIIPCHRVIGSNGNLTGFGGGIEMKRRLLALEASPRGSLPMS